MDIKLLTINGEYESAKKLEFQTSVIPYEWNTNDIVVRWGNSQLSEKIEMENDEDEEKDRIYVEYKNVINPGEAITLNCKKSTALNLISNVVLTPHIYHEVVKDKKLIVVRPMSHTGGSGFRVLKGPLKLMKNEEYATAYINTDTEFRSWFCGNKTMAALRVTKNKQRLEEKYHCRSMWPYKFCRIPAGLHNQTLLAAKVIGLDAGAADVLFYKNKFYFLELNSAPSLDNKRIVDFYKKNLPELAKEKFPN